MKRQWPLPWRRLTPKPDLAELQRQSIARVLHERDKAHSRKVGPT
jgi:hypothetical protein